MTIGPTCHLFFFFFLLLPLSYLLSYAGGEGVGQSATTARKRMGGQSRRAKREDPPGSERYAHLEEKG